MFGDDPTINARQSGRRLFKTGTVHASGTGNLCAAGALAGNDWYRGTAYPPTRAAARRPCWAASSRVVIGHGRGLSADGPGRSSPPPSSFSDDSHFARTRLWGLETPGTVSGPSSQLETTMPPH